MHQGVADHLGELLLLLLLLHHHLQHLLVLHEQSLHQVRLVCPSCGGHLTWLNRLHSCVGP